jgi:hypothetical protein
MNQKGAVIAEGATMLVWLFWRKFLISGTALPYLEGGVVAAADNPVAVGGNG